MTTGLIQNDALIFSEFNYTFKWVDDGAYGYHNKETGEWNGLMHHGGGRRVEVAGNVT